MLTSRLASFVCLSVALSTPLGCAVESEETSGSTADAVSAFPSQCPQFARGHVAKGTWAGDARGCVVERCAPGWANAEPDEGIVSPRMKGVYKRGILGMIDDKNDGCESSLAKLVAAGSSPGVENLGALAGDVSGGRSLTARAVGNHVYRVRVNETHSGLPKPQRVIVAMRHYASMPYEIALSASRGDSAAKPCTGSVSTYTSSDVENDASWKGRPENANVDFSGVKELLRFAAFETKDVLAADDSFDLYVRVSLADPSASTALGDPTFFLEIAPSKYDADRLPLRCEP
ncbi:MAG: hypothetical protein KF819_18135 [Labilithrix sp.]|nr:hypothetical protein [Labilithrix sp.]